MHRTIAVAIYTEWSTLITTSLS